MKTMLVSFAAIFLTIELTTHVAAQSTAAANTILLTVIMRHDQSKTLDEINAHLDKTGFRKNFPPEGVEIVSYHTNMGDIGAMNEVKAEYLTKNLPAWTAVGVTSLAFPGQLLEIKAIAVAR